MFWRAWSGPLCELDAVTARDPSADSGDGFGTVFARCPYVGHQRLERPEPQVIGAPPAHLVQQPGIDPGPDHCRRPQRVLSLIVLGPGVSPVLGKVALANAFEFEVIRRPEMTRLWAVVGAAAPVATGATRSFKSR
jgi:hypothetical protein